MNTWLMETHFLNTNYFGKRNKVSIVTERFHHNTILMLLE